MKEQTTSRAIILDYKLDPTDHLKCPKYNDYNNNDHNSNNASNFL